MEPRVALCASCDRCRARKTKCDGNRPCSNCANKYMKKHRLDSIEGIDLSLFECVYSPAKRRGPVPGKASQARKSDDIDVRGGGVNSSSSGINKGKSSNLMRMDVGMGGVGGFGAPGGGIFNQQQAQLAALMGVGNVNPDTAMSGMSQNAGVGSVGMGDSLLQQQLMMQQQQQQQQLRMQQGMGMDASSGMMNAGGGFDNMGHQNLLLQQQLLMQQMQQLQQHQQHQQQQNSIGGNGTVNGNGNGSMTGAAGGGGSGMSGMGGVAAGNGHSSSTGMGEKHQRTGTAESPPKTIGLEKSVTKNLALLEKSSVYGNRLRSHYNLSIDSLFKLPPVPSDEEYCAKLNVNMTPAMLPPFDVAALRAARFAEVALGALVSNHIAFALELSNATVVCLKQCVEEPVHPSCMFDVAKAYFLHGIFRSYRGDMEKYFKYRRVGLNKLSQLSKDVQGIQQILAAISFHDSMAYMVYNASEIDLPSIDDAIPQIPSNGKPNLTNSVEQKYQTSTDHSKIASNPANQMWVQGAPPVFINNEAPPLSRCLDALACAIRSCCDQANDRFSKMSGLNGGDAGNGSCAPSVTSLAVTSNQNELCARNMVLSAYTLLQQSENANKNETNHGHNLLVHCMDAFLEGGDESDTGGISDSQIQSLLSACNTILSYPYLLYQCGPTYHMICNAAILLCHMLNGLYSKANRLNDMEATLFDEVLDTYLGVRKLLNAHRKKIPLLLRCHGLPRPNLLKMAKGSHVESFINLGETQMCASRGCQGFVLMACSPCVAAERAQAAEQNRQDGMLDGKDDFEDLGTGFDSSLNDLAKEVDLDDDALLSILGNIVAA